MRRVSFWIAVALVGTTLALLAGCGGSDPDAAKTPANAPTITNGQPPTDTGGGGEGEGDATAGKTTFEGTCQSCHPAGGTQQGAGPVLADRGLASDAIRAQIVTPRGAMPASLVSGADLDNVVAFVTGLQGGDTASGGGGGGDDTAAVAAGKTFFEGTCQSCHPAGGTQQGVGPILAGKGLSGDRMSSQIVNGGAAMPAGLASGADLENVTKFVLSLQ